VKAFVEAYQNLVAEQELMNNPRNIDDVDNLYYQCEQDSFTADKAPNFTFWSGWGKACAAKCTVGDSTGCKVSSNDADDSGCTEAPLTTLVDGAIDDVDMAGAGRMALGLHWKCSEFPNNVYQFCEDDTDEFTLLDVMK